MKIPENKPRRLLIRLSYDGTNFSGWQAQNHGRTVQSVLEKGFAEYLCTKVKITGSGRTDSGVHALGQCAHFDYHGNATAEQLIKGVRKYLPDDVQIVQIIPVSADFHARYDAMQRYYRYFVTKEETPFTRRYRGGFPRRKVRIDKLIEAAPFFLGKHDFSTFSKDNPAVPDHVCDVVQSEWEVRNDCFVYHIRADRFLHNMVRRIVGAMVSVSHHDLDPKVILDWFYRKQPRQSLIFPAPPQGLYLVEVVYPPENLETVITESFSCQT